MTELFAADDKAAYSARVRAGVGRLGGTFFLSSHAKQAGKDLGLRGWPTYFVGRAGVLGPVEGDIVAAVVGFFPVDFVTKAWEEGRETDLTLAGEVYLQACRTWGRAHLTEFEGARRLCELAERVVSQTEPIGAPLFAGWRSMPLAEDPPARLAQLMTTLREYRGAMHLSAVLASEITPREAILAGTGGEENAAFFGWTDLEISSRRAEFVAKARLEAERLTDRLVSASWQNLDLGDRAEFATLLDQAVASAFPTPAEGQEPGQSLQQSAV